MPREFCYNKRGFENVTLWEEAIRVRCPGLEIRQGVRLDGYTTLRVGGPADLFAEPRSEEELCALMQAARESGFEGQFIIVSGYSDFQIARSALKLKPAGYLLKPIDPDEAAATLARVRAELDKQQETRAPVMSRRVHRVMEMIRTEYAQNLTIAQIAETVGYNAAYLGRAFDQETGMSIREYLTKVRTEKAAALLRTGGRTAEEIA